MPYRLQTSQTVTAPIQDIWDYWATLNAFAELQPPENRFEVTDNPGGVDALSPGLEVGYRLRVAPMVGNSGRQCFTEVEPPHRFVDEQVSGPWKSFRHVHLLREVEGGVEVQNIVDYALRMETLARPLHAMLIVPGLMKIARWDRQIFADKFGELDGAEYSVSVQRV